MNIETKKKEIQSLELAAKMMTNIFAAEKCVEQARALRQAVKQEEAKKAEAA